jgi:hypothetical protein
VLVELFEVESMNDQLSLFATRQVGNLQVHDPHPRSPIAAQADPESSHLAAVEVTQNGQRDREASEALALVRLYPGHTSRELATLGGIGVDGRYMLARRLPELRDIQPPLVRNGTMRACSDSGKLAMTWFPAEAA